MKHHSFLRLFCILLFIIAFLFSLLHSVVAEESHLKKAEAYFLKGEYEEALRLYLKVEGAERVAGIVGASRTWAMIGEYEKAEEICRLSFKDFPGEAQIGCRLAEVLALTGRSDEAIRILEPFANDPFPATRSLVQYGTLLRIRGRPKEAASYFEQALSAYYEGLVFDAEEIAMSAVASWALERFQEANNLFREAVRADPKNLEAETLWGDLFLEKYNKRQVSDLSYIIDKQGKNNDKTNPH